jgi:protein-S-isoprenylcysteine O-methyltransferase Ste14
MNRKNHPGIYVPPPLIYAAFFFSSKMLEKIWPVDRGWLETNGARIIGRLFLILFFLVLVMALRRFIVSRNTVITIKPARSLQTGGIYALTRNPMYLALVFLYCGLAILFGNWWSFFVLPLLIIIIQSYVIRLEEQYLQQAFGSQYDDYAKRVRRWI